MVSAVIVLAVVGSAVGVVALAGALPSLCSGEMMPTKASDDDSCTHPRLNTGRLIGRLRWAPRGR
jgi:hypothetical protein